MPITGWLIHGIVAFHFRLNFEDIFSPRLLSPESLFAILGQNYLFSGLVGSNFRSFF